MIIFFLGLATGTSLPFFNVYFSQFHRATTRQIGLAFALARLGGVLALLVIPTNEELLIALDTAEIVRGQ